MALTAEALPAELRRALVQLARTPRLLVACDYDGTLASDRSDRADRPRRTAVSDNGCEKTADG